MRKVGHKRREDEVKQGGATKGGGIVRERAVDYREDVVPLHGVAVKTSRSSGVTRRQLCVEGAFVGEGQEVENAL